MTILVLMTQSVLGEDGNVWAAGTTHNATKAFADVLFMRDVATAPFLANKPVLARNSEDGYELVLRNGVSTQLTGAWEDLRFPASGINPAGATSPASVDQTVTDSHVITDFGDVLMNGKRESSMICSQIRRQGGTDANAGTARLYEFDIHYQIDKQGTSTEIPPAP